MRQLTSAALLILVATLGLAGCSGDAGTVDSGGVSLVISNFNGQPSQVGMEQAAGAGIVTIDSITLSSIIQNPALGQTDLQTVRLRSYEIAFTRADSGTRIPTPLVEDLISTVPPGGTTTYNNLPILRSEQLLNPPLSDLLFVNGGTDDETGSQIIKLNLRIRFFGRTLGGRDVVSSSQAFTVEFRPTL